MTLLVPPAMAGWRLEPVNAREFFACDAQTRELRVRSGATDKLIHLGGARTLTCLTDFPLVLHGFRQKNGEIRWCLGVLPYHTISADTAYRYGIEHYTAVMPADGSPTAQNPLFRPDDTHECALMY